MSTLLRLTPMLKAADLKQTIDFYTNILGFRLDGVWPEDNPSWCSLSRDEARIMFMGGDEPIADASKLTGVLYIRTDDVLALYERLKDEVKILWGPEIYHYGMHEFAIADCNGYTLSFGQETDQPPTCRE